MPVYLVEAYTPAEQLLPDIEERLRSATRRRPNTGAAVRYLRTIFIPDDQTCFHLLEAAGREQAQAVVELATLEAQRIVEAVQREP